MFYYNCCGQKYWLTILHKLRFLHCFCHFIETKNGKNNPLNASAVFAVHHTAYGLYQLRFCFACAALAISLYRFNWSHCGVLQTWRTCQSFFFFFSYKHISETLLEFMLNWGCSRAQVCVLWFLSQ